MTRAEIKAFFPLLVFPNFGGLNYAVPTLAWLLGPCRDAFRARLFDAGLMSWKVRWECRDFARAFACFAQEANALTPGGPAGCDALAVGEIWFKPDGSAAGLGHAICPCITDHGLVFIEPQTGAVRPMSPAEIQSTYFLRF